MISTPTAPAPERTAAGLEPRRRRGHRLVGGVAAVSALWVAATALLFLARDDAGRRVAPADAVVVLAGGGSERLDQGLRLAAAGTAPVLVLSDGAEPSWPEAGPVCRGEPAATAALPAGTEVLCPAPNPQRTAGEAAMVARLAAERNWQRVVVVTTDFHALRSRLWFERCAAGAYEVEVLGVPSLYENGLAWRLAVREQAGLLAAVTVQPRCPTAPV